MVNKRPRIALVTHSMDGGVWTVTNFIAQALRQHGGYAFDIVFLATSAHDPASVRLLSQATWWRGTQVLNAQLEGIPYYHVGAFLTEFEFQRYQPRRVLTDLLNQYDLIQVVAGTPAWAFVTSDVSRPVALFAATTAKNERVAMLRRATFWRKYWLAHMTRMTSRIEQQALRRVDVVLAESDYTLKLFRAHIPADRLVLGVPGVDAVFFSPASVYAENGYWLWVGRLNDPRKNIRLLLEAYARLVHGLPCVSDLILAGSGEWSLEYAAQAAALGITEHVQVYCDASAKQLRDLYRGASLFVLSSDEEGLGMVILEAMACGLPVISTDCGGPATAIVSGETGLLTPAGDAQSLADAMQYLLENPALRRQMGQAARQVAVERFSVASAGKVYLDEYDRLLARGQTTREQS